MRKMRTLIDPVVEIGNMDADIAKSSY